MNATATHQNPTLLLCLGNQKFKPCANFQEASETIQNLINTFNLGSSDFYKNKNVGMIYNAKSSIIAKVSYNGRVWKSDGSFQLKAEEITNLLQIDLE